MSLTGITVIIKSGSILIWKQIRHGVRDSASGPIFFVLYPVSLFNGNKAKSLVFSPQNRRGSDWKIRTEITREVLWTFTFFQKR